MRFKIDTELKEITLVQDCKYSELQDFFKTYIRDPKEWIIKQEVQVNGYTYPIYPWNPINPCGGNDTIIVGDQAGAPILVADGFCNVDSQSVYSFE